MQVQHSASGDRGKNPQQFACCFFTTRRQIRRKSATEPSIGDDFAGIHHAAVVRESDRNSAPTPVTLTVPAPTTCKCRQIPIDSAEPGMLLRCPLLIRTTS